MKKTILGDRTKKITENGVFKVFNKIEFENHKINPEIPIDGNTHDIMRDRLNTDIKNFINRTHQRVLKSSVRLIYLTGTETNPHLESESNHYSDTFLDLDFKIIQSKLKSRNMEYHLSSGFKLYLKQITTMIK